MTAPKKRHDCDELGCEDKSRAVHETRIAQGLPATVEDPATLRNIATLLHTDDRSDTAKRSAS